MAKEIEKEAGKFVAAADGVSTKEMWSPSLPPLRDQFAIGVLGSFQLGTGVTDDTLRAAANAAYRLADAMLVAREPKP